MVREEVKGFALTVKENYIDGILDICEKVRPSTFLQAGASFAEERPLICPGNIDELVIVADETALICAIDPKQIVSWPDFEYVLCLVLENRILKLYQTHLAKVYQSSWLEVDQMLQTASATLASSENEGSLDNSKKKKKRRKQKKRGKKLAHQQ